MRRSVVLTLCVVSAAVLASCEHRPPLPGSQEALIGQPAPDLRLTPVQGEVPRTLAGLQGRTAVVELWATWCGACRRSLPEVAGAVTDLERADITFLALNVDARTPTREQNVNAFLREHAPHAPAALDDGTAVARFAARVLPTTIIVAADGRIVSVHAGAVRPDSLVSAALAAANASGSSARD
ncbi:MAG: TlpA family protein disulfide reductase [Deltaproteobacteria bacterium]|nr:MAG: TlpA family protein disulfide reductase [Deltaproteobacteria bacterium]